jgi:hypothetical protein
VKRQLWTECRAQLALQDAPATQGFQLRSAAAPLWRETLFDWVATPMPAPPTQSRLIPIVTTAAACDPVALAELYTARWPQQENIIRDFLIPLGLDTNHGYAKTPVENSEVAKQRTTLEQRRDRLQQWADSARTRHTRASLRAHKRYKLRKEQGEARYRELARQQDEQSEQGMDSYRLRHLMRERKAAVDSVPRPSVVTVSPVSCGKELSLEPD